MKHFYCLIALLFLIGCGDPNAGKVPQPTPQLYYPTTTVVTYEDGEHGNVCYILKWNRSDGVIMQCIKDNSTK